MATKGEIDLPCLFPSWLLCQLPITRPKEIPQLCFQRKTHQV
jgi:hypothetical protein